jgi:hypothetical protein
MAKGVIRNVKLNQSCRLDKLHGTNIEKEDMIELTMRKGRLIYKPRLLAITLIVIIALGMFLQSLDWGSSLISVAPLSFIPDAFADHGEEIILSLNDTSFAQKSPEEENQVKVVVNYATQDPMAVHDLVKGVMKVYSPNGTLLKTSSSPTPFQVSTSGKAELSTTLSDNSQDSVTAKIVFTNPIKTETVSNELLVKMDLIKGIPPSTPDEKQIETEAAQNKKPVATALTQKENEEVSGQGRRVPSQDEESQAEEQQPITPQAITPQPIRPTGPLFPGAPHTFTSETANSSVIEICGDGLDNDADALIDLRDGDCLVMASPSTQAPQEKQLTAASTEVCDDTLDNDLDAKIDSEDEECVSIPPLNQQLKSSSQEGQESENSNNNDDNNEEEPASDEEDKDDKDDENDD